MKKLLLAPLLLTPWLLTGSIGCTSDETSRPPPIDAGVDAPTTPGVDVASEAGSFDSIAPDAGATKDATADAAAPDARADIFVPMSEGQPASVWWDDATSTLFIADNQNNQVWTWTDTGGLAKYATTSSTPEQIDAGATLVGQIVRQSDGTVVVARFGSPRASFGAVAYVGPDGSAGLVPGVDPARHHLGLGLAPDKLYGSYFAGTPGGAMTGAVTKIDLQNGETDYATGFAKIVGVLVANGHLYVSDQGNSSIYVLPVDGPVLDGGYATLATLPVPDQISSGPDGTLFSGQFQAAADSGAAIAVRQIWPDGGVTIFRTDPDVGKPSGLAYDAAHRRLFVADSSTLQNGIHIFPIP